MRIGLFTETYFPTPDGVSHYLRDLKHELEGMGHEVFVFSLTGDHHEKNVFVPQLTVPILVYSQYRVPLNVFPFSVYRRMLKAKLDIIHIQDSFYMGSLGYRVARAQNIPVVATFHTDFSRMKDSIKLPLKNSLFSISWRYNLYLYKRCSVVFCPSDSSAEIMNKNGVKNIIELPLFVNTEKYGRSDRREDNFIIQYIGRITRDKGVLKVLDLAEKFRDSEGITIKISGTGPAEEIRIDQIRERNRGSIVQFTGLVTEEEKIRLLSDASFFISPSESDTFGLSVLEALSCGKPAIVSDNFPLLRYAGRKRCFVEADFSNIQGVAERIVQIRDDKDAYRNMSDDARNFVTDTFSSHKHAEKLIETYEGLVNAAEISKKSLYEGISYETRIEGNKK